MDTIWQDIRYGLRIMAKNPDCAAIAILLTIAFGCGLHVAIASLMATAHRRNVPVRAAGQLVVIAARDSDAPASVSISYPMYLDPREKDVITGVAARCKAELGLTGPANGARVRGELVSGNYYEVLGVTPWIVRLITEADDHTSITSPVAVLSYEFWENRFGMDPAIVNRTIFLNGYRFTIIGVTPPEFVGTDRFNRAEVQVPLSIMKVFSPPVLRATRIDPLQTLRYE
jgi:hypothetical protein